MNYKIEREKKVEKHKKRKNKKYIKFIIKWKIKKCVS